MEDLLITLAYCGHKERLFMIMITCEILKVFFFLV